MEEKNTPPTPAKNITLVGKIETAEQAEKIIKDVGNAFYVVAGLQLLIAFFLSAYAILDAVFFAILGFLLKKTKHVAVAALLAVLSLVSVAVTLNNQINDVEGGRNIYLAILLAWVSVRAVQATLKLRKKV